MNRTAISDVLLRTPRLVLALIFVVAGVVKFTDIIDFSMRIGDFGLVHDSLLVPAAWIVALAEIFTGIGLVLNVRACLYSALVLLTMFVGVLAYGVFLGLDIECGCFGHGYQVKLKTQLLIDLGFILLWAIVFWSHIKDRQRPVTNK